MCIRDSMNTAFDGYAPYKGEIQYRKNGSLIAFETGEALTYGLFNAQELSLIHICLITAFICFA